MPRRKSGGRKRRGHGQNGSSESGGNTGANTEDPTGTTQHPTAGDGAGVSTSTALSESPDFDLQSSSIASNSAGVSESTAGPSTVVDVHSSAAMLQNEIEALITEYSNRMRLLSGTEEYLVETSRNLRVKMDKRLDKLQQDLTDNLTQAYSQEKKRLEDNMEKCINLKSTMEEASASANSALETNDPVQFIMSYQKGMDALKTTNTVMEEFKDNNYSVSIKHELDVNSEEFLSGGLTLGTIKVIKTNKDLPEGVGSVKLPE